jgi:hypothetical protein
LLADAALAEATEAADAALKLAFATTDETEADAAWADLEAEWESDE